jgi:hypothetical protein
MAATPSSSFVASSKPSGVYAFSSRLTDAETLAWPLRDDSALAEAAECRTRHEAGAAKVNPGPRTSFVAVGGFGEEEPHALTKSARMKASETRFQTSARGKCARATTRKEPPNMANTKYKVTDAADTVKPYVERALRDEELRESVRNAYNSARTIYDELIAKRNVTNVATRVATDKDIQAELRATIDELRNAAGRVQGKREDHGGRNATLLTIGIALGILFNPLTGPKTRKWLADRIFGGDGDFTYQGENGSAS